MHLIRLLSIALLCACPAIVEDPPAGDTAVEVASYRLQWGGSCKVVDMPCSFHTGKIDCERDEVCVAKRNADCSYDKPRCIPRKRPGAGAIPGPIVVQPAAP
jgi:hypothetical protein